MLDLVLEKKTGFSSLLPFTIVEPNGQVFYSSDFTDNIKLGRRLNFNLPAGIYKYDGAFTKLPSPVAIEGVAMPAKERNIAYKRYSIRFGANPNKCTIFYDTGEILFDSSFLQRPLYVKYGIYFHELGHHWYRSEDKADLFAAYKMLILGFNPSQVGLVLAETLSSKPESDDRKGKMADLLKRLTKNKG